MKKQKKQMKIKKGKKETKCAGMNGIKEAMESLGNSSPCESLIPADL
jgi:predicted double-glycine peptidase